MGNDNNNWYVAGLAFECMACGKCCAGPEEGYVWLNQKEISSIAEYLGMDEELFRKQYVRRIGRRFSLVEMKKSRNCVFLEGSGCRIYHVRPQQCRTWPFWDNNISSPESWCQAAERCIGINRGQLHGAEEIRKAADATDE